MSDISEILDDVREFIDGLPKDLSLSILNILDQFIGRIELIDRLPAWARPFVQPVAANAFLHLIVDELKDRGLDGPGTRTLAAKYTGQLFQMPEGWAPGWLLKATDDASG